MITDLNLQVFNQYPYKRHFHRHKCIFIHIPKCAGSSVLASLGASARGYQARRIHQSYLAYRQSDRKKFEKYFKFAFVRDPFDRAISTYEYLHQGGNKKNDSDFINHYSITRISFEEFVMEVLSHRLLHQVPLLRPQHSFIFNFQNELQIDFLGRYENLSSDFATIAARLGLPKNLPQINTSVRYPASEYLKSNDVKQRLINLYQDDFELLSYPIQNT